MWWKCALNLAARLQSHADLGGSLVAHETYTLVKDAVLAEETGMITVKGFPRSVRTHRVVALVGESGVQGRIIALMNGEAAQLVLADPPYNVPIQGHVSSLGAARHPEFAMASGEMPPAVFESFLQAVCERLAENSADGALQYIFMDWRHLLPLLQVGERVFTELKNVCVWNKSNGGMGSLYRSKHELVCVFKKGRAPHVNNIELGRHGRYRTNVWDCAGASSLASGRAEALAMHPTVKPVQLLKDVLLECRNAPNIAPTLKTT